MNKWLIGAGIVLIGAGILFVLTQPHTKTVGVVSIGVIAGTTGDYAASGEAYVRGFELAREEWNKSHTLQFSDVIEDDGFNAQKGVNAYTKLKSIDKPEAYAVLSSFTIDAIANDLHKEGRPVALGFEQGVPATDDNIFQVLPAAKPIQQGLGEYLKQRGFKNPIVVISNSTPVYGNFAAGFVDGYGQVTIEKSNSVDGGEARSLATKILSEKPDVIVFYMNPPAGAELIKAILTQVKGVHPQFAFDDSFEAGKTEYVKVFGNSMATLDGSIVALSKNEFTDNFRKQYQEKYDEQPPFGADMGYNSFTLLATTYAKNPTQWIQNMRTAEFTGADGDLRFDPAGLRIPNIFLGRLEGGKVVAPK